MLPIAIYFFVSLAVVAPWTYRNYVVTKGSIVPVQKLSASISEGNELLAIFAASLRTAKARSGRPAHGSMTR